jgi:transcriptional regulator with XRE-family HTH domain
MSFTEKIRLNRLTKGYSQEYMANELEISQNAYSKLERGETELSVRRIYEIASILDVPISELFPEKQFP